MNSPLEHTQTALNGPFTPEGLAQAQSTAQQLGLSATDIRAVQDILGIRATSPTPSQSRQDVADAIAGPSLAPQDPRTPRSAPDSIKALSQILRILAPLPAHTRNAIIGFILAEYPLQ